MQPGMSVSLVARQASIAPSMLFNWRRRMLEGGYEAVQADEPVVGQTQVRDLEKRVRELERVAGAEDPGGGTAKKTDVAAAVVEWSQGRFAMTTIASTLGVARSNLAERLARTSKPRGCYHKAEDNWLLPLIRQLVEERPSYGYRRITVLLNRRLQGKNLPKVNNKRVLRILQKHGLVLQRHTGRQLGRTHDGAVVALISNVRPRRSADRRPCRNWIIRLLPNDGAPTTSNSPATMARSSASCSRSTPATARSSPGRPPLPGLLASRQGLLTLAPAEMEHPLAADAGPGPHARLRRAALRQPEDASPGGMVVR